MSGSELKYGLEPVYCTVVRCWLVALLAVLLAMLLGVIGWSAVRQVRAVTGRQQVEWLAGYPEPVCEMCGRVPDGTDECDK